MLTQPLLQPQSLVLRVDTKELKCIVLTFATTALSVNMLHPYIPLKFQRGCAARKICNLIGWKSLGVSANVYLKRVINVFFVVKP